MKYTYIVGSSFVNVTDTSNGESYTVTSDHASYGQILEAVRLKQYAKAMSLMSVKMAVTAFAEKSVGGDFEIFVENGQCLYSYKGGAKTVIHNAIVSRIVAQASQGFDVGPLTRFMANLLSNPSKTAIEEGYLFLESCQLPITEDGFVIAYKMVRENYFDIYSNTVKHTIGEMVSMPRFEVDDDRHNTCSRGLHFCSKNYLSAYGSADRSTDRCLLVKINPADIVAIPSDYKNAKGRAWQYEVVSEVPLGWREHLVHSDFTSAPIVSATASVYSTPTTSGVPYDAVRYFEDTFTSVFEFDADEYVRWADTGTMVFETSFVAAMVTTDYTEANLREWFFEEFDVSVDDATI